jgi:hypothetical protein
MTLQMMAPETQEAVAERLLRIAIVLDSYNVSAWIASVIDDLLNADFLQVTGVVLLAEDSAAARERSGHWLFRKYAAWDAESKPVEEDPLRKIDVGPRLSGKSKVQIPELAPEPPIDRLDALIWLASQEPERGVAKLARHGVWFFRQREAAYFWEVYEGTPVTRSALEVLREGVDFPEVIYETHSATVQGWSWQQNRNVPYWRASTFVLRALRRLHDGQLEGVPAAGERGPGAAPDGTPTNMRVAGFLLRNAARSVSRRIRYANKESHWFVAYRTDYSKFVCNSEELDLRGFRTIPAPEKHFYADPFVLKWRSRNYLFVEDYLFAEARGCISVMEIGKEGVKGDAERVLDLPYHLSYPFIFEHDGALYMIPETLAAGRIDLYRAREVLGPWEFVTTLKEGLQAVDTTLWMENGLFYFFTNIAERGATVNDDLYLFYANDLLGEWKPHPANPIVTDVRRSRGAGKLFRRNGKLIRPAQDCSVRYGYACQLNEVEVLTPAEYREKPLVRIEPDWAPRLIGTHTINSNEDFEVIDGQVYGKKYAAKR